MRLISEYPPVIASDKCTWFNLKDKLEYEFCTGGWIHNDKFIPHPKQFMEVKHEETAKEN